MSRTPAWDDNAVCDLLVDLRESMRRYAAGFDASLLSGADASSVVDVAGAIERMAATVKTAAQQTALEWLFPTCAAEGCASSAFLENDHRVDWASSHQTVFDLLDRLCSHHHDLKTIDNWALVPGRGKRAFVPPDDPGHSRRARVHDPPVVAA